MTNSMFFDDIPKYLLSSNTESKKQALEMLKMELEREGGARRPYGSFEPFVVALYHVVFVDRDAAIGSELLKYFEQVLPKIRNSLHKETQEVADIILCGAGTITGKIDKNYALNYIRNYKTTTSISTLVKMIIIIELSYVYDKHLDDVIKMVDNEIKQKQMFFESLYSEHRDVVDHYFIEFDIPQLYIESENKLYIHTYFIYRAKELSLAYK